MTEGIVTKDKSTESDDELSSSRRIFLVGALGVGVAAATAAIVSATKRGGSTGGGSGDVAHGGAIHTQRHGGVTHTHETVSHTHAVMVHPLDEQTLRAVDVS